jgi:hypothetical protein
MSTDPPDPLSDSVETFLIVHQGGERIVRATMAQVETEKRQVAYEARAQVFLLRPDAVWTMRVYDLRPGRAEWMRVPKGEL